MGEHQRPGADGEDAVDVVVPVFNEPDAFFGEFDGGFGAWDEEVVHFGTVVESVGWDDGRPRGGLDAG